MVTLSHEGSCETALMPPTSTAAITCHHPPTCKSFAIVNYLQLWIRAMQQFVLLPSLSLVHDITKPLVCRASFALEEPVTPKSPAVHQMSPRASALPPFHAAHRQSQRHPPPDTNAYPLSSHLGGDAAHFVHTASGQLSIDVLQPSLSDVSAEASVEVQKLKDENLKLADK